MFRRTLLVPALLFALAAPAAAQPSDVPPVPEDDVTITVVGNRDVRATVRQFVSALSRTLRQRQISRFEKTICPRAFGLGTQQRELVERRMRLVSSSVLQQAAPARCIPNVMLIVTRDKPRFMREAARGSNSLFDGVPSGEVSRLLRDNSPVAAWHINGAPVSSRGTNISEGSQGVLENRTFEAASRIRSLARQTFDFAIVVVDSAVLDGLTTTQLADYAMMRGLASLDPAKLDEDAPSILTVMNAAPDAEVPVSLTAWDYGFLRGLYTSAGNVNAAAQRTEIAREVEERVINRR